jgi:tetratricopeptide (TPR) repeat protein
MFVSIVVLSTALVPALALAQKQMSAADYFDRGTAWQAKGEHDKAIADFTECIRIAPSFASSYVARGYEWAVEKEYDKAIADCNEAVWLDPKDAAAYATRGFVRTKKKQYDKAIADFNEAIRLDPKDAQVYDYRGLYWTTTNEHDKAVADFNEAIRLDPSGGFAYATRASVWIKKREYDKAIADFNEAIRLDPKDSHALADFAWLLATCPDAKYRDQTAAVANAEKAKGLPGGKVPEIIDTLAAAYAESGDFEAAVKWQTKARDMAPQNEKAEYQSRLDLYKARKPYRDDPKK